jgi:hypothetical protein
MAMPATKWRQHDITGSHIDPLPVHHGVDIISGIEDETQRSRGMAMRTRCFTRLDHLIGRDNVAGGGVGVTRSRVHHDEVTPFSDIGAYEAAGILQRGSRVGRTPNMDEHFGLRPGGLLTSPQPGNKWREVSPS